MTTEQPRQLPLDGVRVLAQAIVWAGPFGSMILADLGAEVIEVESIHHISPTRGSYRHMPPQLMDGPTGAIYLDRDGSEGFWNRNSGFNFAKRGHKSVTVDLSSDEGRELFFGLIREADVFVENNAADVVDNLGISWETLSEINPRLIMVRFPGFGISGPYEHFKGFGATMESVIGHTMLRGYRDSDPSQTPAIYHGDPNAGAHVATAVQIALIARERTGEGQLIEMSQAEAVIHHTSYDLIDYQMNGRTHAHWGNRHPSMAPYGVFRCAGDDRWLALAVPSDEVFARLCDAMGQPELATDERFADAAARYGHQDELEPLVEAWTSQHGRRRAHAPAAGGGCSGRGGRPPDGDVRRPTPARARLLHRSRAPGGRRASPSRTDGEVRADAAHARARPGADAGPAQRGGPARHPRHQPGALQRARARPG